MTREQLIKTPVFTPFDDDLHATTNAVTITQAERFRILADGIPALSHAVGSTSIPVEGNLNMHNLLKWEEYLSDGLGRDKSWSHSDIRVLAYPFVYAVFEEIVKVLDLKR